MTHTKKVLDHGFVTLRNIAGLRQRGRELLEPTIPGIVTLYKELVQ